jgi:hypothetical protein
MENSNVLRQTEEFAEGSYVELTTRNVPRGWTNHPARLRINTYFSGGIDNVKAMLKADHNIPDARPIITNKYAYVLDGGDKKYYLWNKVSDYVARIEEPNLEEILAKIENEGVSSIKRTVLAD